MTYTQVFILRGGNLAVFGKVITAVDRIFFEVLCKYSNFNCDIQSSPMPYIDGNFYRIKCRVCGATESFQDMYLENNTVGNFAKLIEPFCAKHRHESTPVYDTHDISNQPRKFRETESV